MMLGTEELKITIYITMIIVNIVLQCKEEERRDRWVKELTTAATVCDLTAPPGAVHITLDRGDCEVDVPSVPEISNEDCEPYYTAPTQSHLHPWLEPVRNEGESRHYFHKRQPSTDSDFPRSRSPSIADVASESGYSSSDHELGNGGRSRSSSLNRMPNWEQSQPTSPTDADKTFIVPVSKTTNTRYM